MTVPKRLRHMRQCLSGKVGRGIHQVPHGFHRAPPNKPLPIPTKRLHHVRQGLSGQVGRGIHQFPHGFHRKHPNPLVPIPT